MKLILWRQNNIQIADLQNTYQLMVTIAIKLKIIYFAADIDKNCYLTTVTPKYRLLFLSKQNY